MFGIPVEVPPELSLRLRWAVEVVARHLWKSELAPQTCLPGVLLLLHLPFVAFSSSC